MAKMKSIGKTEAAILHREIDAALKVIAQKYGLLSLMSNTLTFNDMGFRLTLEGKVDSVDENGNMTAVAQNSTVAYILQSVGTPLNSIVLLQGKRYKVTGYNSRRPKMPIDLLNITTNLPAKASIDTAKVGIQNYLRTQPRAGMNG